LKHCSEARQNGNRGRLNQCLSGPRSGRGPEIRDMVLPRWHFTPPPPTHPHTRARGYSYIRYEPHFAPCSRGGRKKEKEENRRASMPARKKKVRACTCTCLVPCYPLPHRPFATSFWVRVLLSKGSSKTTQQKLEKNPGRKLVQKRQLSGKEVFWGKKSKVASFLDSFPISSCGCFAPPC
jgi:hypothetical protein